MIEDAPRGADPAEPASLRRQNQGGAAISALPIPTAAPAITVAEIVTLYLSLEGPELKACTLKQRRHHLTDFAERFGQLTLESLYKSEVRSWIRSVPSWRKNSTRRNVVASLKRLFNWALDDNRIHFHPLRGLTWEEGEPRRSMTDREYRLMLRAAPAIFRRVLLFIRETGVRPSELADLEWQHIQWAKGIAVLPQHKTRRKSKKPRTIYLSRVALELLSWLKRQRNMLPYIGPHCFLNARGRPWKTGTIDTRIERMRARLGIGKDCVISGLRHGLANRLEATGTGIRTTADILSHETTRTTERHYLHPAERIQTCRDALERAAGRAARL